ncbi:ATP-binding protein [Brevibacillus reuszeri]|uniref:HAMP domain-containing sensor histidine kinase n=1 Tax=Brevibacillus reuszeri TaxID=54915 RepID=UPI003D20AD9B
MIKTLYVRLVLTFLAAIVIAILFSSLISLALYEKELDQLQRNEMISIGENILRVYEQTSFPDLHTFTKNIEALTSNPVLLYNATGRLITEDRKHTTIPLETVQKVLTGQTYLPSENADLEFIGMPLSVKEQPYALFLLPSSKNEETILWLFFTVLLLVLIIGSICILIAARYLVKPLKALTQATKQLARGKFDVHLNIKRSDELGGLAQSFIQMAGELKQLEQMRQDFVSNVSHEIQTPLTSIAGFAKALKYEHLVAKENRDYYLDIILAESERLSRLSDQLLRLVSLESSHHPFEATTFHLDEQIRQVVVNCEPLWSAKNIRIDLKLPAPVKITADEDQLNQVWMNLLGNSIKYTPDGGRISIVLMQAADEYAVTIADTGIGITPEDLSQIFIRFYKTDRSRSSKGNGLGLAIVKQIITNHHGSIEAKSTIGQGTTITVSLPADCIIFK